MPHTLTQIRPESRECISLPKFRCTLKRGSSSLGPREGAVALPGASAGHRKPKQATCWTLSAHPRSCAPKPAPQTWAVRAPNQSIRDE